MIGMVTTGKSFSGCIGYCLEDKRTLTEEQKTELSKLDNLHHKDRAEVLAYHKCFGDVRELVGQFNEVSRLSKRIEKPVFHFSLRLAPGETLSKNQLVDIGNACAKEFKVDQNQYICILHKDTKEQHIHIVANRVGYDGKVATDSNSYLRMAKLCRKLEKEYKLKEVLNPRAFLSKQEQLLPRHDSRKERLRKDIQQALQQVKTFGAFEQRMRSLGYQVIKGRGISFIDDKKVKIKGSEVGFSLMKIEKIFALKGKLEQVQLAEKTGPLGLLENEILKKKQILENPRNNLTSTQRMLIKHNLSQQQEQHKELSATSELQNQISDMIFELMRPERIPDNLAPEWVKKKKEKKKRSGYHL